MGRLGVKSGKIGSTWDINPRAIYAVTFRHPNTTISKDDNKHDSQLLLIASSVSKRGKILRSYNLTASYCTVKVKIDGRDHEIIVIISLLQNICDENM